MSVTANYLSNVTVNETLTTGVPAANASNAIIVHDQYNSNQALTATSTVPVTKVAAFEQDLTGGAATIDLTSLTGANGVTVDGTGLKVQVIKFIAKAANANVLYVDVGASNGYDLLGASMYLGLQPGQEITIYGNDATPDIATADKTLDLTGTGTQGLKVIVVMG